MDDPDFKTLEELKSMTALELEHRWTDSKFPYDRATCFVCITQHSKRYYRCGDRDHIGLREAVDRLDISNGIVTAEQLVRNLETIYATRLFFADAYEFKVPASE